MLRPAEAARSSARPRPARWPSSAPAPSFEVPWSRVSTLALPCRQSACSLPSAGSYQAPQDSFTTPGADRVADDGAGEARAARVVHAHHVAVGDAARFRVGRIDRDRLAARDLAAGADRAAIHLAVQPVARLARDEMQRIGLGVLAAEPFPRLDPGRMRRAVVVAEARDLLRIELDPAGRRAQLVLVRIGAEIAEHHVFLGGGGNFQIARAPRTCRNPESPRRWCRRCRGICS